MSRERWLPILMSSLRSRYPHAARRGAGYPTRARPGLIKVPVEKYRVVLLYVALLYPYSTVPGPARVALVLLHVLLLIY